MTTTAASKQAVGAYGETVAARHLAETGLRVLERNWRCDEGEIDLVLRDGDVLVVCEVKTRTSDACGSPHEAVSPAKLDRLRRLAHRWAGDHDLQPPETRIDLVAVRLPGRGAAQVEHVRGIG
ncbi:MAG: YraN family protein [Nocardioides sp.]|nr:YraN family protein [Nocardioides sp.]